MARQQLGIGLADMADAERIDQAVERDFAPRLDRVEQIAHRGLAIALALFELLRRALVARGEREDVGRRHHQAFLEKGLHLLLAQPFDVEGIARDEMPEPLDRLRRADKAAGAAAHRVLLAGARIDLAHGMAAADRADVRKLVGLGALRPLLQHDAEHLRDDIAGALDDHGVADAHVLARDLVLVVQRRVLHDDAADGDRLELGHRRQRAGAADLDVDVVDDRGRLLGREFVRDRPARAARDEAEPLLPVEPVELVDDAVDVVAERRALALDLAIEREHLFDRPAHLHQRIGAKAAIGEPVDHAGLGVLRHLAHLAPGIGEEFQRPRGGDRRGPSGAASPRPNCADWRRPVRPPSPAAC